MKELEKEEERIDSQLEEVGNGILGVLSQHEPDIYVSQSDVCDLFDDQQTVISVKTPRNATCEILSPDPRFPEDQVYHQAFIQSGDGAMQVCSLGLAHPTFLYLTAERR